MKKWMTLIELIAVMSILAIVMSIWSLRIANTQHNKEAKQEIINLYNTFNTHNNNIQRWKSWSIDRTLEWSNDIMTWLNITNSGWNSFITWTNIWFSYSWIINLGKNIKHSWYSWTWIPTSTLYICEKNESNCMEKAIAEIKFSEKTNTISLIWTWTFKKNN